MAVSVVRLEGVDVPEKFAAQHDVVWAIYVNDGVLEYCLSEEEAYGRQAHLELLEEQRKPKFSGPSM